MHIFHVHQEFKRLFLGQLENHYFIQLLHYAKNHYKINHFQDLIISSQATFLY